MKKEQKYLTIRKQEVVKANELIQKSCFSLSTIQQKIVLYLIAQIKPTDEDFKKYEFYVRDFCRICDIDYDNGGNYKMLKNEIKKIRDQSVFVKLPNGVETTFSWIAKPYFHEKSGLVEIRLDEDLKPLLLQLKGGFTHYELIYTLQFRSKFSIRLYELIKSIHYHELEDYTYTYKIEDLKRLMDAENYKTFQHFRDRALDIAVKEINQYSDKLLSYVDIREGLKVVKIMFTIKTKDIIDVLKMRIELDKRMGIDPNQMSLFEEVVAEEPVAEPTEQQ